MSDGMRADTGAVDAFAAAMHQAAVKLSDLDQAHDEAGREVITAARPPRDTSHLANSLTATTTPNGVVFASTARYWTWVHWGAPRRHVRARPWYPEAVRARTSDVVAVYADHVRKSLPS